jgi:hypothetical protein
MKTTHTFSLPILAWLFAILLPVFSSGQIRAPLVSSEILKNYCPANTSNLNHVMLSTPGHRQSIQWYTTPSHSGAPYAGITTAPNGTYYAFLYDSLSNAFSPSSRAVVVQNTPCNSAVNYSSMSCNQLIPLTSGQFGGLQSFINSTGVCLFSSVGDPEENMIDASHTNSSSYNFGVAVGCKSTFRVTSTETFLAGTFAGFKVSTDGLLGTTVDYKVIVSTYNNGGTNPLQEEVVVSDVLALNPLQLGGDGSAILGFMAKYDFDEIRISYEALVGAAFTARVYYPVIGKYCEGPELVANTLTPINNNIFPTRVVSEKSDLLCVGCSISNIEAVISPSRSDSAIITTVAGIANKASIAVQDVVSTYPRGTFAGFVIEKPSIVNLELLNRITLTAFNDGMPVDTVTGGALLSLGSSLLSGSSKFLIGFIPDDPFDEIQITLAGVAGVLSRVKVYEAVLQRFEDGNLDSCNFITSLINPDFPVAINPSRTKMSGSSLGICALCGVNDTYNGINEHEDDYATIHMGVTLLDVSGSYAVKNQTGEFPQGTYAGFEIENRTVVDLSILEAITIKAYKNNVLVDSSLNALGSSLSGKNVLGFVPDESFDEIVLEIKNSPLVSVALGETRIYRPVIMCFNSPTLACDSVYNLTLPDFPVMVNYERTGYSGLACVLSGIDSPQEVINGDEEEHATIVLPATVGCEGAISVKAYETAFPAGSKAGFIIKTANDFLQVDLLPAITLETYRNDTLINNLTLSSLLNIELLGILSNERTYKVFLKTTESFDEVRISINSLVSIANPILVYNAFVDTHGALIGGAVCCSVENFVPMVSVSNESNSCPLDYVDLSDNVAGGCLGNSILEWHTVSSGFSSATLVDSSYARASGQYYAVCFDIASDCYSPSSDPVTVTIENCCPVISNDPLVNTNPSLCGAADGRIIICGLRPNQSNYEVRYRFNGGGAVNVSGLSSDSSGCVIISNLAAGDYTELSVFWSGCPTGSNEINITLQDPVAPSPPANVSVDFASVCFGETITLSGICSSGTIAWYSDSTLINSVSNSFVPASSATYYAVCESAQCKSTYESIAVNVNTSVSSPINVSAIQNGVCSPYSTTLAAECISGLPKWYTDNALTTAAQTSFTIYTQASYFVVCEDGSCKSSVTELVVTPNTQWINGDCDGDGVTNGNEQVSLSTADPVTDFLDPCDYNEAEQVLANVSNQWKFLDCDRDGNPNDPDPHPKVPTALNDSLTALVGVTSTVNIVANDDFLAGINTSLTRLTGSTAMGIVSFDPIIGTMSYAPNIAEAGTIKTVLYRVCNIAVSPEVCDTATVTITIPPVPTCNFDFNPSLSVIPSNGLSGQRDMLVTFNIKEVAGCVADTISNSIRVVLPKVSQLGFDWNDFATSTSLLNTNVTGLSNSDWDFSEDVSFWIWTYNKPTFGPYQISKVGFVGLWSSGPTGGKINFTINIISGTEAGDVTNNLDQEVINFNAINP